MDKEVVVLISGVRAEIYRSNCLKITNCNLQSDSRPDELLSVTKTKGLGKSIDADD